MTYSKESWNIAKSMYKQALKLGDAADSAYSSTDAAAREKAEHLDKVCQCFLGMFVRRCYAIAAAEGMSYEEVADGIKADSLAEYREEIKLVK